MSDLRVDATPVSATGTGAASAIAATITGVTNKTTWITGFYVTGLGATAAAQITCTITGLLGGTLTFYYPVPIGVGVSGPPLWVELPQPLPASGTGVNIVLNVPSFGAGNTASGATIKGYQL
jgi:hypothetical protein